MTIASANGSYPRVLMGPTGSVREIDELVQSLEVEGCTVETFASMPVEVSLSKFDMAVLIIADDDPAAAGATEHRIQRTLHAAGFLEARLSRGRVCLLVEDTVDHLEAPPITQIRYPSGRPMEARDEIVGFLASQYPQVSGDLHRHVPIRAQVQSSDLNLGWAMLAAVILIALIPLVLLIRGLGGGGDDTVELSDIGEALGSAVPAGPELDARSEVEGSSEVAGASVGDDGEGGTDLLPDTSTTAASQSTADSNAGQESSTTSEASSQDDDTAADSGATASDTAGAEDTTAGVSLPSTCTMDVRKSLLLQSSISCTGGGRLAVEGHEGPWHNTIKGVALSGGVSGTLIHEPRSDGTTVGDREVILTPDATTELNPRDASFGTNTITVVFGADGQHVHLYESAEDGGRQVTMTFTIDPS